MNRVEQMQQQVGSYSVKFLEVTRIYSNNRQLLICMFEGQDEKYYAIRLDLFIGQDKWRSVNCGGKKEVLRLFGIIKDHQVYKNVHYACFIDKDYDNNYNNPLPERIYVTPCYSIENFYSTDYCFRRVLSAEFGINDSNESTEDFVRCLELFNSHSNEFAERMLAFNCWVKAHRIMEYVDKNLVKLNVQNVKTKDLIDIELDGVHVKYDENKPEDVFKDFDNLSFDEAAKQEAAEYFDKAENFNCKFRGKQQLDFVRILIMKLKLDRTSKKPKVFSQKGKIMIALTKDNCISELSQYAVTPDCLKSFLSSLSKFETSINGTC